MGFPENVLAQGEKVERSLHPHPLTVFGPTLLGVVLIALAAGTLALALVVVPYLRWRTTHYVITSHRVMVRKGILSKSGKDITLSKITDVSFRQTFFDRIIRSGTLSIESAGDSADELLRNIPRSDEIQQLINRLIDEDAKRRSSHS